MVMKIILYTYKREWRSSIIKKKDFLEAGSLSLIKNDVETLKYLGLHMKSPTSLMLLPYICLCCNEALNFLEYELDGSQLPQSSISYKQIRNKLKLFSNSYGKSIKQIKLADSQQDKEFKEKLRVKWLQPWNIHYNLGVYCNTEGRIVGNTQFVSFLLQNPSFSLREENRQDIYEFSVFLGSVLQRISQELTLFESGILISENEVSMDWLYQDYNTNKNFNRFPYIEDGKEVTLFLLHLLSTVNFVGYELPRHVDRKNPWFLRIQYITAYYVNKSLKRLNKIELPNNSSLMKEVENRSMFNSSFRSCMFHYGFYNKEICAIKDEYLVGKPFFGLIESCFEGESAEVYQELLEQKISRLSKVIEKTLALSVHTFRPLSSE